MENIYQKGLFDDTEENKSLLHVVRTQFICEERKTWEELFEGYDKLYALTYSTDCRFMKKLFQKFEYSEVIFGFPNVLNKETQSFFDVPLSVIKYFGRNKNIKNIAEKISNGQVKLLCLHDFKSHAKQYVLESNDGSRHRVITGSANMSTPAMKGFQAENFVVDDSDAAFHYYKARYDYMKEHSGEISNNLIIRVATEKIERIEDILSQASIKDIIGTDQAFIVEGVHDDNPDYISTPVAVLNPVVGNLSKKETDDLLGKKDGVNHKLIILPEHLNKQKRLIIESQKVNQELDEPSLIINYLNHSIELNGELIESVPDIQDIKRDINCIISYFNGLKNVRGDANKTIADYWLFTCWFYATPFIARLRLIAAKRGYEIPSRLDNFGVIYGNSNAGKTFLIKFLVQSMDGHLRRGVPIKYFTPSRIDRLRNRHNSFPIFFEDASSSKWGSIQENLIKEDNFGLTENMDNYPCVCACMNHVGSFKNQSKKRCLSIKVESGFDAEDVYDSQEEFKQQIKDVKNDFYKAYLLRMLDAVGEIETAMLEGKNNIEYNIAVVSSRVIIGMIQEYNGIVPSFMTEIDGKKDIVANNVKYSSGISLLAETIKLRPLDFEIQGDRLIYSPPTSQNADIHYLRIELPYSWREFDKTQMPRDMIINLREVLNKGIDVSKIKGYSKPSLFNKIRKEIMKYIK